LGQAREDLPDEVVGAPDLNHFGYHFHRHHQFLIKGNPKGLVVHVDTRHFGDVTLLE
jgi:hypothetical protein